LDKPGRNFPKMIVDQTAESLLWRGYPEVF
jgi:hypothetical protein